MRRRDFITWVGGVAAWPVVAHAQQTDRVRRIGVLLNYSVKDQEGHAYNAAFVQRLQQLGWADGRNVRIETRWTEVDAARTRKYATELVALKPDVVLAQGAPALASMLQATRRVPIVFVQVTDPVGGGFVASLALPGGNATGFTHYEYSMGGKWLELLKELAPNVTRAAVLRNPAITSGIGQFGAIQSVAPLLNIELRPIDLRDAAEIEREVKSFAAAPNGGLIVTASGLARAHSRLIVALAARYKLPAVYSSRTYIGAGALMSYGPSIVDQYRRAAGYVDRILKGERPVDLPVQAAIKYDLVINLKSAKALGLTIPPMLLARADQVIE